MRHRLLPLASSDLYDAMHNYALDNSISYFAMSRHALKMFRGKQQGGRIALQWSLGVRI